MQGLSTQRAPSATVVLPHFIFGAISFLIVAVLILFSAEAFTGHYFHPKLLAITHIAALGWGSMIIFGALYQLLPVILETPLYSELIARITFVVFAAGIVLIAFSFWNFYVGIHIQIASGLLLFALILFSTNVIYTCRSASRSSEESEFIITSAIWLLATGIIGTLMAFNFQYPFLPKTHLIFLKIHAHLGIVGWFILLIMGVAAKLIPMFLLSQNLNRKKLNYAYYLVNVGLIAFGADMFFYEGSILLPLFSLIISSGILFFLSFIYECFRKRLRKELDIGLKHSFVAFLLLLLPLFLSIVISIFSRVDDKLYILYGSSVFIGFITALILGQTYKTLPFIVWLHKYKSLIGKEKIPLPKDLFSEKIARGQFITYLISITTLILGIYTDDVNLIRFGAFMLLITALLYNFNVIKIIMTKTKSKTN
jgi:hypothetical protein